MTPEEFATTQIKAMPEEYTWNRQNFNPTYGAFGGQSGWTGNGTTNPVGFNQDPSKYSNTSGGNLVRQQIQGNIYRNLGYTPTYINDPSIYNYAAYQSALGQAQQQYLTNNPNNRPV
jgi:hypothetical protein